MIKIEGVKIKSFLPGRLKLRIDDLEGEPQLAEALRAEIAEVDGIKHIETDAQAGTVLIKYDKKRVTSPESSQALFAALKRHFPNKDFSSIEKWLTS